MLGLYIHVPFCSAICNYCNFNRGLFDAALKERYVGALVAEIEGAGRAGGRRAGGQEGRTRQEGQEGREGQDEQDRQERQEGQERQAGKAGRAGRRRRRRERQQRPTRSTSAAARRRSSMPAEIDQIIAACRQSFDVAADCEVTLEANPETTTTDRLRAYRCSRRQPSELRRPVVPRRRVAAVVAPARRGSRPRAPSPKLGRLDSTTSAST